MDTDSPAGSWSVPWLRRYGDGTMPVVSMVLDGYLAYKGGANEAIISTPVFCP